MKRIFSLVTVSLMTLAMLFVMPVRVSAANTADAGDYFDLSKSNSLIVGYHAGQSDVDGVSVKLYRVAGWSEAFDYVLADDFAESGIRPQEVESNDGWLTIADTLNSFIQANSPKVYAEAVLKRGKADFSELPAGLYFIPELTMIEENGIRKFSPVLLNLPDYGENTYGEFTWLYDVTTAPKSETYVPTYKDVGYTLNIVWDDKGYEKYRPESVTVDIYANGEFVENVTLSPENNWHYQWTSKDDGTAWTVRGSDVNRYDLTVKEIDDGWILEYHINIPDEPAPPTPRTGEDFPWLSVVLMVLSGVVLIVLGVRSRRSSDE